MTEQHLSIEERLRRKMARPARVHSIATRFTEDELKRITDAAKQDGVTVREWSREAMLRAASGAQTDTPIFTEVVALRMLMNIVLKHLATSEERMSPETFAKVLGEVREGKHRAARDVLQQYGPPPEPRE